MPRVSAIVAFDEESVMGKGNEMPWYIPADFKHFKKTTMGCPVIMGRKTWDSLPRKPLPGRTNIVLSASVTDIEGVKIARSLEESVKLAGDVPEVFIIGGKQVYNAAFILKMIDRLVVSHVHGKHDGDVYFSGIPEYLKKKTTEPNEGFDVVEYWRE
jgi:dihydrofolate reductase